MRHYRYGQGKEWGHNHNKQQEIMRRGRPLKEIMLKEEPKIAEIIPKPLLLEGEIILSLAEYEAMRLVDLEGCEQEEAGELMNISRGTIWRLLESGRRKMVEMITTGRKVVIEKM